MTAKLAGHGRLSSKPQPRNTKSGISMAAAFMYLADTAQDENADDLNVSLVAFNKVADQLLKLDKGELLSVSGDLKINEWQTNEGTQRKVQIVVQDIVSNKVTRPGGRKKKVIKKSIGGQASHADFDDDIPAAFN